MPPEPIRRPRTEDLAWRDLGGELVVVDLRTSSYLTLNAAGTRLWLALVGGASRAELEDELRRSYGIDADRAASDVAAFLDDCDRLGLLGEG